MTKRIVTITVDYRLSIDTDNIQIECLTQVDPKKSPQYDEDKHGTEIRHEWKTIGKYYGTIPAALSGILEHALRNGEDTDVRGLLVEFDDFRAELRALWSTEM